MIDPDHPEISMRRQCELTGLNRASLYYEPAGESQYNLYLTLAPALQVQVCA